MASPLNPRSTDPRPRWLMPLANGPKGAAGLAEPWLYPKRTIWVDLDAGIDGDGSHAHPFNGLERVFASDHLECVCRSLCRDCIRVMVKGTRKASVSVAVTREGAPKTGANPVWTYAYTASPLDGRGRYYASRLLIEGWGGPCKFQTDVNVEIRLPAILPLYLNPDDPKDPSNPYGDRYDPNAVVAHSFEERHPKIALQIDAAAIANLSGVHFRNCVFETVVTGGLDKATIISDAHGNNAPSTIGGTASADAARSLAGCTFEGCTARSSLLLDLDPKIIDIEYEEEPDEKGPEEEGGGGGGGRAGEGNLPGWQGPGQGEGPGYEDGEIDHIPIIPPKPPGWDEDYLSRGLARFLATAAALRDVPRAVLLWTRAEAKTRLFTSTPSAANAYALSGAERSYLRSTTASATATCTGVGTPREYRHVRGRRSWLWNTFKDISAYETALACATAAAVHAAPRSSFLTTMATAGANSAIASAPKVNNNHTTGAQACAYAYGLLDCPRAFSEASDLSATASAAASGGSSASEFAQCAAMRCPGSVFNATAATPSGAASDFGQRPDELLEGCITPSV